MISENQIDFFKRHVGILEKDIPEMLKKIKVSALNQLIMEVIPKGIQLSKKIEIPPQKKENEYLTYLRHIMSQNRMFKNYIGLGYYPTITPSVIRRNLFENPGWYTSYTPYQAEISQGRLEALLNFQTMVSDLTALEIANASLLDEATAAAESMMMLYRSREKDSNIFFVSEKCFSHTIEVIHSRAEPLGIEVQVGNEDSIEMINGCFGLLLQNPDEEGLYKDHTLLIQKAHEKKINVIIACDLLSLTLLKPPGEMDADIAVGSSQRFGVPMGYGGPSAAFLSCKERFKRLVPGRIIGVSKTIDGKKAYRMALQTREQHIRKDKATSNICTAQALLAIMAAMYAVYHGPEGLKKIALDIHQKTAELARILNSIGYQIDHQDFFDTLKIKTKLKQKQNIRRLALKNKINFRYFEHDAIGISLHEAISEKDIQDIVEIFSKANKKDHSVVLGKARSIKNKKRLVYFNDHLKRTSEYLSHLVFHNYHSETKMMRYLKFLENKDISLTFSMIPLGSCTMKLNAATAMLPISWPEVANIHPFSPLEQTKGYQMIIHDIQTFLANITGLPYVSLQPNSGAQGEFAGLLVIRAYFKDKKQTERNIALIPTSAHGTNPASAVMAGMEVIFIQCDPKGNIDLKDLRQKADVYSDRLALLMVTYPSTHGVFEENIQEICEMIHQKGGFVYMDGANMNAQVGLTSPKKIGADVCHLNLHKTFAIPHGGGGPGLGPIAVNKKLAPYLPGHSFLRNNSSSDQSIQAIAATPWGSPSILLISHAYISMLGSEGLRKVSEYSILNANYLQARLKLHYKILYTGKRKRVAHELMIDLREFKKTADLQVEDIAKRLADYGFHAPTISWPVEGTMMIEPTESESKEELDRFCDAMISIRKEIKKIEEAHFDIEDNPIKRSPHTHEQLISGSWDRHYSREEAAYPLPYLKVNKFWPSVSRIENAYGDRNLVCTCPPIES